METHFENMELDRGSVARERMVSNLKTLANDAEELLRATAGDASEKVKEVRSRLSSAVERAKVACTEWQEQTAVSAREAAMKADTVIREHPYESVGIGFGIGLLIGVLVGRR